MMPGGWKINMLNIFYFFLLLFGKLSASPTKDVKQTLVEILNNTNYSSNVRPDVDTGLPTIVTVDLFLETVGVMDHLKQIPVSLIVSESWTDPRLNISASDMGEYVFYENMIPSFWTPKLYLTSTDGVKQDQFTKKIIAKPGGDITFFQRNIANILCQKSLSTFPLDGQICVITLKTFYYNVEQLILRWNPQTNFKESIKELEMSEFYLKGIFLTEKNISQFGAELSMLNAEISLGRKMSLRIMAVYLTSTFLVIIAWLSFWVDCQSTAARISLGLITLLTLITHNSNLVPHSTSSKDFLSIDIKGLDIWLTVCLNFVFFALVEFILVNYCLTRKATPKKNTKLPSVISLTQRKTKTNTEEIPPNSMVQEREVAEYAISDGKQKTVLKCCRLSSLPLALDKYCRIIFPIAFIIFNIIYWVGQTY